MSDLDVDTDVLVGPGSTPAPKPALDREPSFGVDLGR